MIVVDATVLADLLIGEERFSRSAKALAGVDADWIAPSLWRYELGNVLWKVGKFKGIPERELRSILLGAELLLIETVEELDKGETWDIAWDRGLSFYDASYVWLAKNRSCELFTRDGTVLANCAEVARTMPQV